MVFDNFVSGRTLVAARLERPIGLTGAPRAPMSLALEIGVQSAGNWLEDRINGEHKRRKQMKRLKKNQKAHKKAWDKLLQLENNLRALVPWNHLGNAVANSDPLALINRQLDECVLREISRQIGLFRVPQAGYQPVPVTVESKPYQLSTRFRFS